MTKKKDETTQPRTEPILTPTETQTETWDLSPEADAEPQPGWKMGAEPPLPWTMPSAREAWEKPVAGQLAAALSKAQAALKGAAKDSTNPHFKSQYADLASVWEACRKPLADNGLSIVQFTQIRYDGAPILVTRLLHASGESVEGVTPLLMGKQDMQALGSAITYARRYGLAAMVGVAPEDDDGNAAVAKSTEPAGATPTAPAGYQPWLEKLQSAAVGGLEKLREAFKSEGVDPALVLSFRDHMMKATPALADQLRKLAEEADKAKPKEMK